MEIVRIGVDIGKQHDPTAIVVAELDKRQVKDGYWDWLGEYVLAVRTTIYKIRHVERLNLGGNYLHISGGPPRLRRNLKLTSAS
ncbi:MAG: hypothetical protein ABIS18_05255 [Actinomycetota bacterium]